MSDRQVESSAEWLEEQIKAYKRMTPQYALYADVLKHVLKIAAATLCQGAVVEARPKSIASFAEKALRKRAKYSNPLAGLTDLCGARVIAPTRAEVEAVDAWIEEHFEISLQDSDDASTRLGPVSFGYASMHYVVAFRPGVDLGVEIPDEIYGLKAEIQVRTLLQHVWATLAHRLSYKSDLETPPYWQRQFALLAAELENAEDSMERMEAGLQLHASGYRSYLEADEIKSEIATLRTVLRYDEENAKLACRIARLASSIAEWDMVVDVLTPFADGRSANQPTLLTQLGHALYKRHQDAPDRESVQRSQGYLERAGQPPISDSMAVSYLADTWRGRDEHRAGDLYRRAFELDPANYHALVKYLEHKIGQANGASVLPMYRPVMEAALKRCQQEAEMGINSPWPLYGMAHLQLLRGDPDESLKTYCRAIRASTAPFMIEEEIDRIERLSGASGELDGFELVRLLLLVGAAARFPSPHRRERLDPFTSHPSANVSGPVVIVAGGTDSSVEERLREYSGLLLQAFDGYHGTIISGGTTCGVSGLVGDIGEQHADHIRTIGYLPDRLPDGVHVDSRYSEIRPTGGGTTFSALEPLRYWADLLAAGIEPRDTKLLGINGGHVAGHEFRIALLVGAMVGLIPESGREADKLLADEAWLNAGNLIRVPDDPHTMRVFIESGVAKISADLREAIGRTIHAEHRREQIAARVAELPDWDQLDPELRESSMLQADHIWVKLRRIGCDTFKVTNRQIAIMFFTDSEIETLAEMEHGRWNVERLSRGWTLSTGKRVDYENKRSPYLVPWANLANDIREWDRETVRRIPEYLAQVQLEIRRVDQG